ncbi:hypothetical protein ACO2Q8_26130 [Larkinella sp. VNQ87]|uniref:hypothetical protein n=1 Tax=Larkinella sp. VNQ87 TaxID=3400921 RepID=UPI003C09E5E0
MAWIINYHNLSSRSVGITHFGGVTEAVVGEVNHQPASPLDTGSTDYLSLDQNALKFIADGAIDIYQGVRVDYQTLWVRIHVPIQVFGIGSSPYWYYQINDGSDPGLGSHAWNKHDSDSVSTTISNLSVKLSPTKDHSNLTVDVTLDDQN